MELWDLYTFDRNRTGLTHVRGEKIPEGLGHLVVHVWIQNSRGEFLISQRSASRYAFPLLWETVGGSVVAGEDSLTGALREAKEEIGIALSPEHGRITFSQSPRIIDGLPSDHILDVWRFSYDGPLALESATTDEVAQCRWMTRAEIQKLSDSGQLVPTLNYFFTTIHE